MVRTIKGRNEVASMRPFPLFEAFEFSVHKPSASFVSTDVLTVFPDAVPFRQSIYVITTFQPFEFETTSTESLIASTESTKKFKDLSREKFFSFMEQVQAAVECIRICDGSSPDAGDEAAVTNRSNCTWVDWTDPATGLPVLGTVGPATYCECDALEQLCSVDVELVAGAGGACRMVQHPKWGVNVYPASGFVAVPSQAFMQRVLEKLSQAT